MNENDGLRPNNAALRLFFEKDTLYLAKEESPISAENTVSPSASPSNENPAIPVFEGGKNPALLFLFSHDGDKAMKGAWGEMISGLLYNEKAMNMKQEDIALVNMQANPSFSLKELQAYFQATQVVIWGSINEPEVDHMPEFEKKMSAKQSIYKLLNPDTYMEKEGKMKLWLFIKNNLLA